jgi:hypothetical protein
MRLGCQPLAATLPDVVDIEIVGRPTIEAYLDGLAEGIYLGGAGAVRVPRAGVPVAPHLSCLFGRLCGCVGLLSSHKKLGSEKPWIECEWRDRSDRNAGDSGVPVIDQHIAIRRAGDRDNDRRDYEYECGAMIEPCVSFGVQKGPPCGVLLG